MAEQIHNVSDLSKLNDLKFKKKPIVAYFYTDWCPPCKPVKNILDKELKASEGKFVLACINCDEADQLNIQYEIEGVPTVVGLNCDEKLTIIDKLVGYTPQKFKFFFEKINKGQTEIQT